jgi:hypothetical protein
MEINGTTKERDDFKLIAMVLPCLSPYYPSMPA